MNHFQGFSLNLIKRFAIQILISLYFLTENNIVHCDLKPENVIIMEDKSIKLIDFGSCHFFNAKYFVGPTPEYLPPEILL
jgi:dual specificity tyrosine-phosphorylation-regulated kinase 2/3/4